jgi:hypothetical protein
MKRQRGRTLGGGRAVAEVEVVVEQGVGALESVDGGVMAERQPEEGLT